MATGDEEDSELQEWMVKYKLTRLADRIKEEEITLDFLSTQDKQDITEIAEELTNSVIQRKKFIDAVIKYQKTQKQTQPPAIQNKPSSHVDMKEETKDEAAATIVDDSVLSSLISMGFDKNESIIALKTNYNDITKSIELLTTLSSGSSVTNDKSSKFETGWDIHKSVGTNLNFDGKLLACKNQSKWSEFNIAFLKPLFKCDNKKHIFKFKLIHVDKPSYFDASPYGLFIGISESNITSFEMTSGGHGVPNKQGVFVLDGWTGKFQSASASEDYKAQCKSGDILEMIVDTWTYTISYSINSKSYGVVSKSKISGQEWRAFVAFNNPRHKIEFTSYESKPC